MHHLLLAALLLGNVQDTAPVTSSGWDSTRPSYAPTLNHASLLRAARLGAEADSGRVRTTATRISADFTRRRRPVQSGDLHYTRLKIHRVASYLTVPLFVVQYLAGRELYNKGDRAASWARDAHGPLAAGVAGLFAVNTVTGVWNRWDSRKGPDRR
jgi:hypothetical protein